MIKIKILYDNYPFEKGFLTGWGFSCLVQLTNQNILFDTGGDPFILKHNFKLAGTDPKSIDKLVISHYHGDHTGGLKAVLSLNKNLEVFLGKQSYNHLGYEVFKDGKIRVIENQPLEIFSEIFVTEELGGYIKEVSLLISTKKGFVLITGCAHPGIINILRRAIEIVQEPPFLLLGGLHLLNKTYSEIKEVVEYFKSKKVKYIAVSHCTGDKARDIFRKEFKEDFINAGAGKEIVLEV